MNFILEILPIVAFFAAYVVSDIFYATAACIIASWVQILFTRLLRHEIRLSNWLSTILITMFGGATILLHDKAFIMLKPTVFFWLITVAITAAYVTKKNILKYFLKNRINLPDTAWHKLSLMCIAFTGFMGAFNLFIAYTMSEYTWVKFKIFGITGCTVVFAILVARIIAKNSQ